MARQVRRVQLARRVLGRPTRCGSISRRCENMVRTAPREDATATSVNSTKIVWLAGQIATVDDSGKSLAGDFEGQARQVFKLLGATLEKAGGKLSDMVQMTVFITDVRSARVPVVVPKSS
jgi:enamine deaminase RidA (YjgF/YER057c/UK114 family)